MIRPVVRCLSCKLNQFQTKSGYCRRCGDYLPPVSTLPTIQENDAPRSIKTAIGKALLNERTSRNLSIGQLSKNSGLYIGVISRAENGRMPNIETLGKIAAAFGLNTSDILLEAEGLLHPCNKISKPELLTINEDPSQTAGNAQPIVA